MYEREEKSAAIEARGSSRRRSQRTVTYYSGIEEIRPILRRKNMIEFTSLAGLTEHIDDRRGDWTRTWRVVLEDGSEIHLVQLIREVRFLLIYVPLRQIPAIEIEPAEASH